VTIGAVGVGQLRTKRSDFLAVRLVSENNAPDGAHTSSVILSSKPRSTMIRALHSTRCVLWTGLITRPSPHQHRKRRSRPNTMQHSSSSDEPEKGGKETKETLLGRETCSPDDSDNRRDPLWEKPALDSPGSERYSRSHNRMYRYLQPLPQLNMSIVCKMKLGGRAFFLGNKPCSS
jgi:hypothetical protein